MPIWLKLIAGSAFFILAIWAGLVILRRLANPGPDRGHSETVDVEAEDVRYRCGVCGLEIRMTRTPADEAKPPRHCMEEMEPVDFDAKR